MYGLGILKGMRVTLANLVRRPFTIQYPDRRLNLGELAEKTGLSLPLFLFRHPRLGLRGLLGLESEQVRVPQHPRFRGEEFTWYLDRCTGCANCAQYCPLGIIKIVTDPSGQHMQEGQTYKVEVFDIDLGRCMFCGLCVEACPYDALFMGSGFGRARYERDQLVIPLEELDKASKRPSTWFRPQLEEAGYVPADGPELNWEEVGRRDLGVNVFGPQGPRHDYQVRPEEASSGFRATPRPGQQSHDELR